MSKLAETAKKVLGTQTVKIDDIIRDYDGVVTINGIGYTEYKGDRVPVFSFVEGEGASFWGGCKKLRELATELEELYGDLREVNAELQYEGIKIKISPTIRTKGGNPFRPVTSLGTVKFETVREEPGEYNPDTGEVTDDADAAPF